MPQGRDSLEQERMFWFQKANEAYAGGNFEVLNRIFMVLKQTIPQEEVIEELDEEIEKIENKVRDHLKSEVGSIDDEDSFMTPHLSKEMKKMEIRNNLLQREFHLKYMTYLKVLKRNNLIAGDAAEIR